jgi:hypothetical protein
VGPWEWDVKRLAGSLAIAGEHMGIARDTVSDIVATAVHEYRDRMDEYAGYSALDLWNEIVSFERMLEAATSEEGRRTILKAKEKAAGRTNESMLNKMAAQRDGQWWIQDAPPAIFHPSGPTSLLGEHDQWSNTEAWRGKLARVRRVSENASLGATRADRSLFLAGRCLQGGRCRQCGYLLPGAVDGGQPRATAVPAGQGSQGLGDRASL